MPIIGDIVQGAGSVVVGLIPRGGVPLTRYGRALEALAKSRRMGDAPKWAREHEKAIDDGEDAINWQAPGRSGIPGALAVEELWAGRIVSAIRELPAPPLSRAEWESFANTDRGGNCLRRGLIPPKTMPGPLPPNFPPPSYDQPVEGAGFGYMLPTQNVTARDPIAMYLTFGVLLVLLATSIKGR